MIWKIAQKEFLLNLMMFKFVVGTVVCVVLTSVFVPVLAKEYQQKLKAYNENVAANEAKLRQVVVYKDLTPTIYQPPALLSVFCEGLARHMGNSAKVDLSSVPEIDPAPANVNPFLCIFPTLDLSLVFKVVISLLALLVAYDATSGERERGTLKLTLSNPAARHEVLLGKLLAGLLTLIVPVTATFLVALLILGLFPMVDLHASDWVRIGLLYVASLLFVAALYNIGLLFSCLTRSSAISLVLGLFSWVAFVIVIPNGCVYLARRVHTFEPKQKMEGQLAALQEAEGRERRELEKQLPSGGSGWESDRDSPFGGWYPLLCTPSGAAYYQKRYALLNPLQIKYVDKYWEVRRTYLAALVRQGELVNNVSRVSPICLYGNVASALAGTDLAGVESFLDGVRAYRERIIEYMRARTDNFSSPSYFTPSTPEERIEFEKCVQIEDREASHQRSQQLGKKVTSRIAPLELRDLPRFVGSPGTAESLRRALPDLALLVVLNALFFALSFVAFLRYDVR